MGGIASDRVGACSLSCRLVLSGGGGGRILINNLGDEDVKGNTVEELQARKLKISNQFFASCKLGAEVIYKFSINETFKLFHFNFLPKKCVNYDKLHFPTKQR